MATRLPPEFRVTPPDALLVLQEEVFFENGRPRSAGGRPPADGAGRGARRHCRGRIYDAHIAEIARAVGASVVVTDNRRHCLSALRYGMRVETPAEFLAGVKSKRS